MPEHTTLRAMDLTGSSGEPDSPAETAGANVPSSDQFVGDTVDKRNDDLKMRLQKLYDAALEETASPVQEAQVSFASMDGISVPDSDEEILHMDVPAGGAKTFQELPPLHTDETNTTAKEPLPELHCEGDQPDATDTVTTEVKDSATQLDIASDVEPFNVSDEEIMETLGVEDVAVIDQAERTIEDMLHHMQEEQKRREIEGDLYDVVLDEAYNPFRARLETQALEVLNSAMLLQKLRDSLNHSSVTSRVTGTVDNVWNASIGKVVKDFQPTKWVEENEKSRALARYNKCCNLVEIKGLVLKEIEDTKAKMSGKFWPADPTCNAGTVAGAIVLLTTLNRRYGVVGVKIDDDLSEWLHRKDIEAVVSMTDFAGVYVLFNSVESAQKYRKYMLGKLQTSLVDLVDKRNMANLEREESLSDTGLRGSTIALDATEATNDIVDEPPVEPASADEVSAESSAPTEAPEERNDEPATEAPTDEKGKEEIAPYRPFKPELLERAVTSLLDAKAYQQYEDHKMRPHGIRGFIAAFRGQNMPQAQGYGGSYNSGYGYPYSTGYGSSYNSGYNSRYFSQQPRRKNALSASISQGIENLFADCDDVGKFFRMQDIAMRKIPRRLLSKARQGKLFSSQHDDGLGAVMACKVLQLTLAKSSGVTEVLLGSINGSNGYSVILYDFNNLRCVLRSKEDADNFISYMSEWVECGFHSNYSV